MKRTLKTAMNLKEYDDLQEAFLDSRLGNLLQVGRKGVELEGGKEALVRCCTVPDNGAQPELLSPFIAWS